jgi:hypothetical protein
MAHFARIDENDVVLQVIVINNENTLNENGIEDENIGILFCKNLLGGKWIQTSYNGNIRKNYAGIGYIYDEGRNAFIPPQPFASWVLNEETCGWNAPTPIPSDWQTVRYYWNEPTTSWVVIQVDQLS